jgi:hypothetical protein
MKMPAHTTMVQMPIRLVAALLAAALSLGPGVARAAFGPGEQLEFSVDYLKIRAAQARITVGQAEGDVWPVIAQAKTDGLGSLLDVREHLVSYWDSVRQLPRGSDLQAVELGDRHTDTARFDRDNGKAHVRVLRKGKKDEKTYALAPDAHDFASALLWMRLQPLAEGGRYEIPIFTTRGPFKLAVAVVGKERIETPAGDFDTVKVQVRTAFEGNFASKRDTFIWFSDDARHVPVRVSAEFAIGSIVATLSAYRPGGDLARN